MASVLSATNKFTLQPTSPSGLLTSSDIGGQTAGTSASFQPIEKPQLTEQSKLEQPSDLFLSASTAPPQTTEPPASSLLSPETGVLKSKPSPFKTAAEKFTSETGKTEIPDAGEARAVIDTNVPSTSTDTSALNFLQGDEFFNNLVKTFQDYLDPKNQRKSLTETYQTMLKDSGIQALDMELINTKAILEGSEEDLRTEITKAGGFATESQVLALTNARNKQLIKNYNTLLDTRNVKSAYLNTMIGLEQADRQAADAKFEQSMNFAFQIADYKQKMKTNAIASLDRVKGTIGWKGLLESTQGDPYTRSLIEKTYGLPSGGLEKAVAEEARIKAREEKEKLLESTLKEEQILTQRAQRAKTLSEIGKVDTEIVDVGGRKFLINSDTGATIREIAAGGKADDTKRLENLDSIETIKAIQVHSAFDNAVGPQLFKIFTRGYSPAKTDFIGEVEKLVDNLNLNKLIEAKGRGATFGALSDNELRVLASAATKIGTWRKKNDEGEVVGYNVQQKNFRKELDRIASLTKRAYILSGYAPEDVGAIETDDGKVWAQNYDGSLTEIYTP